MPRPRKCRQVCRLPRHDAFAPVGCARSAEAVVITVDEYETIRLIDYEGLSQEECAASMGVARTTVQQIYNTAREKLSAALVEGRPFRIQGGDYRLCQGERGCRVAAAGRVGTRAAPGNRLRIKNKEVKEQALPHLFCFSDR